MLTFSTRHVYRGTLTALALAGCSPEFLDPILTTGLSSGGLGSGSQTDGGGASETGAGDSEDGSTASGSNSGGETVGEETAGGETVGEGTGEETTQGTETGAAETGEAPACEGEVAWTKVFASDHPSSALRALAVDPEGNVVIAGEYYGEIDFGVGPMVAEVENFESLFVAKLGPDGETLWSRSFGMGARVYDMTADSAGNVVVVGSHYGIDFGGGPLAGAGELSGFVVALGPDGAHRWSRGVASDDHVFARGVGVDDSGSVVVSFDAAGTVDVGGGPIGAAVGIFSDVVVKYDVNGGFQWHRAFSGTKVAQGAYWSTLAVGGAGDIAVGGTMDGLVDFGDGIVLSGDATFYVATLAPDGELGWVRQGQGSGISSVWGLATDGAGRVHVGGSFSGELVYDGATLQSTGQSDLLVGLLDGAGDPLFLDSYGSGESQHFLAAVDANFAGERVVTGWYNGDLDLGGGVMNNGSNSNQAYVAKQGPLGEHVWSRTLQGTEQVFGHDVAIDESGSVWLAGIFDGTLTIGDQVFVTDSVDYKMYVARYCP